MPCQATDLTPRMTSLFTTQNDFSLHAPCRPKLEARGAAGDAGDGPLLLLVRAVTLQTRTVSNNALRPAPATDTEAARAEGAHMCMRVCTCMHVCMCECAPPHAFLSLEVQEGEGAIRERSFLLLCIPAAARSCSAPQ